MPKVLVVDDEKPLAKALELKLGRSGIETHVVFNGEEALDFLNKEKVDLVLLDLVMPKMDGFKVMEELFEKKITPKIIVTSNLGQEEDAEKAKNLGAIKYFVKSETPINQIVEYIKENVS